MMSLDKLRTDISILASTTFDNLYLSGLRGKDIRIVLYIIIEDIYSLKQGSSAPYFLIRVELSEGKKDLFDIMFFSFILIFFYHNIYKYFLFYLKL